MDYKLINKIIDDVYGEFGSNYENALRELFYEYDKQKEIIDKAIEIIEKYGYEKQMEEDYLMNRVNLANYNCLLLNILKGGNK